MSRNSMKVMSPMLVTVSTPPRKGVWYAPGAAGDAACTTDIFQNGLLVWTWTVMRFVLLVAEKVRGSPFGEVAVTGMISDLPAGMLALGIGSIVGAPKVAYETAARHTTIQQNRRRIINLRR